MITFEYVKTQIEKKLKEPISTEALIQGMEHIIFERKKNILRDSLGGIETYVLEKLIQEGQNFRKKKN